MDIKEELGADEIGQLIQIKEIEERLSLPEGFFLKLLHEDDWSFIIKLHALAEAAMTHLLVVILDHPELEEIISRLELSNPTTGKLAFAKSLNLIDSESRRFIQKLSELRNKLVHDVNNVGVEIQTYFTNLSESDRKGFHTAFKWGKDGNNLSVNAIDGLYDLSEVIKSSAVIAIEYSYKMAIWLGTIIVLIQIHEKVSSKAYEKKMRSLDARIVSALDNFLIDKKKGI